MSHKNHHNRHHHKNGKPHIKDSAPVDETNPIIMSFKQYSLELDDKHDRYERIVKLSRDITIDSKRIIFLLHTIDPNKNNKEKVLQEASNRLKNIISYKFFEIAKELENRDPFQYLRAYCFGLQEFIEAYSYHEYLSGSDLSDWRVLQEKMVFSLPQTQTETAGGPAEKADKKISCLVEPTEYILGLADLTGELMRRCINSLGSGDTQTCFESCAVLQNFYKGYLGLHGVRNREFGKKVHTLHESVLKAENVCYNVKVRGGEAARRGPVDDDKREDLDEGFY